MIMDKIKTPVRDGKDTSILDANGKQIAFAVFAEMAEIVDALNTAADRDKYRDACERLIEHYGDEQMWGVSDESAGESDWYTSGSNGYDFARQVEAEIEGEPR